MAHSHSPGAGSSTPSQAALVPAARRRLLMVLLAPFVVATVIGLVWLWPGSVPHDLLARFGVPDALYDATVVRVDRPPCLGKTDPGVECQVLTVRLDEGPDVEREVALGEMYDSQGLGSFEPGDRVVLSYQAEADPEFQYSYNDRVRRTPLLVLGLIFAGAVIALGRWQGVRALVGLAFSFGVLGLFVLPAIIDGRSPLAVSLVGASTVALAALYLAHGFRPTTTVAVLGTLLSLMLVGLLGIVFMEAAHFTGLGDEDASFLQLASTSIDLRGLLLGGVVIGALGVLDDVTVTQVSAVWELRQADPSLGHRDLYRAGLRVGRDHVASTVNTLVLAYAGASLPLLLLFTQLNQSLGDTVNGETVAVEVVRALVGSIGLVAAVPITTWLAAYVLAADPSTRD